MREKDRPYIQVGQLYASFCACYFKQRDHCLYLPEPDSDVKQQQLFGRYSELV